MCATTHEPKVAYNFLGKCGVRVSNVCLGTMTFDKADSGLPNPRQLDEVVSHSILDHFGAAGGNFIDTADAFSKGKSEEIVGDWLTKQERDRFVIAAKVRCQGDPLNPNTVGLSRRHIIEGIEGSLKRLKTDYIDLYQMHTWDSGTPIKETLCAFDDLVRCGKVRYIGVSDLTGWQLQKMVDTVELMGLSTRVVSLQQQYNLLCRFSEMEQFEVCRNEGIGVLSWSPLKGGLLSGRFKRGVMPVADNSRVGFESSGSELTSLGKIWDSYSEDDTLWKLIELMGHVALKHDKTIAQVALRWLLQKDIVTSVVVGVTSIKQLEDSLGSAKGWELSAEEMQNLDGASAVDFPYPYNLFQLTDSSRHNPFNR